MKGSLSHHSLEIFNKARNADLFCDAILETEDGGQYRVHKCILMACSPYFNTLFSTLNYGNKKENRFVVPGISKTVLGVIVDYAYVHRAKLDFRYIQEVLSAADEYSIIGLMNTCSQFLWNNINARNCIGINALAERFQLTQLQSKSSDFLMRNFMEVAEKSEELMEMPGSELVSILNNEELNVRDEEVVWETAICWIERDVEERKKFLVPLMRCVRLGLVNADYFMRKIKNHPYVVGNAECRPVIIETLTFLNDLSSIGEKDEEFYTPYLACPRIPNEVIFAIGGWSSGKPTNCIETYDTRADRWIRMDECFLDGPRAYHRCVVIDHEIYVIGGFDGKAYFSGCRCFDVVTKQWKDLAPMHCKRCYVSVAVLDGIIYAMGGYDGVHRQNTAEKYERVLNQWTMIAPMHCQRSDACATVLNRCVYITGGFNGTECLQSVEYYSPSENQWTMIAPMRSRRSGVSCVTYKGQLYVLGGFNGMVRLQSVEKYTPWKGVWSYVPDMLTRRSNFATEIMDDMIFAVGGYNGDRIICQVECYSEIANQWFEATDMNVYRSALAICVVGSIPNIRDYVYKERNKLLEEKRQRLIEIRHQEEGRS